MKDASIAVLVKRFCPQGAIHYAKVKREKCIGCGRCWKNMFPEPQYRIFLKKKTSAKFYRQLLKKGIDCIEFHAMGTDEEEIYSKWKYINENYEGFTKYLYKPADS